MKLTEHQLSQLFRSKNNSQISDNVENIDAMTQASSQRLNAVEKIANNSRLSASYKIINNLQQWSQTVGLEVETKLKPQTSIFSHYVMSWLKPSLATAAVVTAVYFITPEMTKHNTINQNNDQIMFVSNFEKDQQDIITSFSFDKSNQKEKSDVISQVNFG